jgi:hypothetical protein
MQKIEWDKLHVFGHFFNLDLHHIYQNREYNKLTENVRNMENKGSNKKGCHSKKTKP